MPAPVTLPPAPAVSVSATSRGAAYQGRSLGVRELSVRAAPVPWLTVWGGSQDIVAHGRSAGTRFGVGVWSYGARASLLGGPTAPQELALSYEHLQTGHGQADTADESATFAPVGTQTVALSYRPRAGRLAPDFGLSGSRVRGGAEGEHVLGVSAGLGVPLGGAFRARLGGSLFHQTGSAGEATVAVLSAGVSYAPAGWATLHLGVDVAPRGLPVAGTALTGLSSFLIYRPGGAAQELTDRAVGFGTLRLTLSHAF